jgi:glutamate-ammonia-ligase adenylyltransferase
VSKPVQAAPELPSAPFRDPDVARRNLARISGRVPEGVLRAIPPLLVEIPDPDAALNLFERLTESAPGELFRAFDRDRVLVHYALVVFGHSHFLGETLIQNTDLFNSLQRDKILDRSRSREEYREALARFRSRSFETDTAVLLARFKRREYIRIMLRDVLGSSTLGETTAEITDAAFRSRYGSPQQSDKEARLADIPVTVLSLGKLGGSELNYSSDIDLLFLYGDGQDAGTTSVSTREYFVRLAQAVTDTLSRITKEGSVFRVDLRLRPQGGEGEPAISLSQALHYYSHTAADWELQALIKVRHSAGDIALSRRFIRAVQPYVYREEFNFAAIETALTARDRIGARRRVAAARGSAADVKLDRGGIRDIEFLVQCLQRVYGGNERWLRSGGTLFSLQKLHDKGHLTGRDFHELTTAYEFLRKLEHRLQLRQGQQTHKLPKSRDELGILARSMNAGGVGRPAADLDSDIRNRMAAIADIYHRMIHHQQWHEQQQAADFRLQTAEPGREQSERQIMARLAVDSPSLHKTLSSPSLDSTARRNLSRFLSAAFTSSERYTVIARSSDAIQNALDIFRLSDYLTDILVRYPEEIAGLSDHSRLVSSAPQSARLFDDSAEEQRAFSDPVFSYLASAEVTHGEKMSLLRRHYRHRVLSSGARDVVTGRKVYESLADSSAAADEAIGAAFAIAGQPAGLAVLALGRLGTREFDLLSDVDLLFVRSESLEAIQATHAAEQLMHALSAYTREGTVFPVDARLRPRGAEGELVISVDQLRDYFLREAQPWEALSFTKLRHITGSAEVAEAAGVQTTVLLGRFTADNTFTNSVCEMRYKLERADAGSTFNLKTGPGAVYDIDFLASYLTVRHRVSVRGNTRQRLRELSESGVLTSEEFEQIDRAAELYRAVDHAIRLATGRAHRVLPVGEHSRFAIEELTARILGRGFEGGLEPELLRTAASVRSLFHKLIG